jgi:hypothetical protein
LAIAVLGVGSALPVASAEPVAALQDFQLGPIRPLPGSNVLPVAADSDSTIGWSFEVVEPIQVGWLGFYDQGDDGLREPHLVGIWDGDGQLLTSALVEAAQQQPLVGSYRYSSVDAVLLLPGDTYIIGATVPLGLFLQPLGDAPVTPDGYPFADVVVGSVETDALIAMVDEARIYHGSAGPGGSEGPGTLHWPVDVVDGGHFFAPNFLFEPVPEPSTVTLLYILLTLSSHRRHRRTVRFVSC